MAKRLEVIVAGRVQGVAFRWHTLQKARELGLTGSVRNLADGTVAVVAEGDVQELNIFLAWLDQGPPHAQVTGKETRWGAAQGEYSDFLIVG